MRPDHGLMSSALMAIGPRRQNMSKPTPANGLRSAQPRSFQSRKGLRSAQRLVPGIQQDRQAHAHSTPLDKALGTSRSRCRRRGNVARTEAASGKSHKQFAQAIRISISISFARTEAASLRARAHRRPRLGALAHRERRPCHHRPA